MRRLTFVLLISGFALGALGLGTAGAVTLASPIVITGAASAVTSTGATLAGTVDPVAQATTYVFEYGTTTSYGQQTAAAAAGNGVAIVPASATLTGLTPGTTYHFRIDATNASGTSMGTDAMFTTAGGPTTGPAVAIAASTATLTGTLNPAGVATTYSFEYGTTNSYGQQTPVQSAGAGTADVPVSVTVTGLTGAVTYHYRITTTRGTTVLAGADQIFVTPGPAGASTFALTGNPATPNNDLATTVVIGSDPSGTPVGQAAGIAEALSSQFANQLSSFGSCAAAAFANAQGPTAANCPDRTSILGAGTLVTRDQTGAQLTSDAGFLVKTADNRVVFWYHTPGAGSRSAAFGQIPAVVTQEMGTYGPVVTYDLTGLPGGARVKQLALDYQRNPVNGKLPFAATGCTNTAWSFQARIVYVGGVAPEFPATTLVCQAGPPTAAAPEPSKLQLARATIDRAAHTIDILAPITRRASGNVSLDLYAAGQHFKWTAPIDSVDGRILDRQTIPAAQAAKGTGILTITYAGNANTRPQVVRLRAANAPAALSAARPTLTNGHLVDQGTISSDARGVVRVQLEYYSAGRTTTLQLYARVANGSWSLNQALTASQLAAIAGRQGAVESYILFTGYLPRHMRGEMLAYQVLGAP